MCLMTDLALSLPLLTLKFILWQTFLPNYTTFINSFLSLSKEGTFLWKYMIMESKKYFRLKITKLDIFNEII